MKRPKNHVDRELELMLSGEKPMAVFYRDVNERIDEKGGQDFDLFVRKGLFDRTLFYIRDDIRNLNTIYYVYTSKGQKWRAEIFKTLKKECRSGAWKSDMEYLEGFLLGYTNDENILHLEYLSQFK